jgi:O-antigen/teichoic acid export membrane protein
MVEKPGNSSREQRSLTSRATAGVMWTLVGTGGQTVLKFIVLMVLARILTPAEFGIVGAAVVVITFLGIFAELGVAQALIQLPELDRDHLVAGFHISLVQGILSGAIVYLAAGQFHALFNIEGLTAPIQALSLVLVITGFHQVSEARIRRNLRFRALAVEQVISYGLGYGLVAATLGLLGYGAWALVWGTLAQALLRAVILTAIAPPALQLTASGAAYKDILHFGGGHALAQVGMTCAYQVDNLIVGRFLGADMLGIYGRAFQVVTMPTKLLGVGLLNAMFPIMSRVQSEPDRLARAFLRSLGLVAMVGMPFSIISAILAPEIVLVLLGPRWPAVIVPFQILSLCIVFRVGHKICEALVRARGAVYRLAWTQWAYTAFVTVGAYAGHFAGLPGVAAGVAIAVTANFILVFTLVASLSGLSYSSLGAVLLRHFVIASAASMMAFAAITVLRTLGLHEVLRLLIVCGSVALIYASAWILRPSMFGDEGDLFKLILGKFMPAGMRARGAT